MPRAATRGALLRVRGGELAESIELLDDEEQLDQALEEAGPSLVVVDFYAEWCGPCKKLAPVLERLAQQAGGKVRFYKVDVDQSRELAAARAIKSMPTIQFFRKVLLGQALEPRAHHRRSLASVCRLISCMLRADARRVSKCTKSSEGMQPPFENTSAGPLHTRSGTCYAASVCSSPPPLPICSSHGSVSCLPEARKMTCELSTTKTCSTRPMLVQLCRVCGVSALHSVSSARSAGFRPAVASIPARG